MIFQWVFIPWLQCELDCYCECVNHTVKCHDRNKVLPHGVAELIFNNPQDYGALQLKIMVNKAATTHVCQLYIDPGHPIFDLVPGPLNEHLEACYNELGRPSVTRSTVWTIYLDLLHTVQ
ncbi:hypothetical protein SCLCIDRAFT_43242, partial [Scleroderma citrinum Foug A]